MQFVALTSLTRFCQHFQNPKRCQTSRPIASPPTCWHWRMSPASKMRSSLCANKWVNKWPTNNCLWIVASDWSAQLACFCNSACNQRVTTIWRWCNAWIFRWNWPEGGFLQLYVRVIKQWQLYDDGAMREYFVEIGQRAGPAAIQWCRYPGSECWLISCHWPQGEGKYAWPLF